MRRACRSLAVPALLVLALLTAACGDLGTKDEPPRPFGPGAGNLPGGAPSVTTPVTVPGVGTLEYDNGYFTLDPPPPGADATVVGVLTFVGPGTLSLRIGGIFGRPDTPCRFHAALLARDEGFTISGDGEDRVNDRGVVFHEVVLVKGAQLLRLDCAQLTGIFGVEMFGDSLVSGGLDTQQVHAVLNSIRP
jgi:hypothetical protein